MAAAPLAFRLRAIRINAGNTCRHHPGHKLGEPLNRDSARRGQSFQNARLRLETTIDHGSLQVL